MARNGSPNPNALRLHVSGGTGSGKSYVLKAIVALIKCPALKEVAQSGGLLTVAFQGKQAASVGGSTGHSVCDVNDSKRKGAMDSTAGQTELSAIKAARWAQLKDGAIAMGEIPMISSNGMHEKTAAAVRLSAASLPHAGFICVTFGDLNQVRLFLNYNHSYPYNGRFQTRRRLRNSQPPPRIQKEIAKNKIKYCQFYLPKVPLQPRPTPLPLFFFPFSFREARACWC